MPPPTFRPLAPVRSRSVPVGPEWIYELKLDGFRGVLTVDGGRGSFTSKNGHTMRRFQELADALAAALPFRDAVFDGEILVMGESGPDFNALFFRRGEVGYAAFDLLWLAGKDLRGQPLWRRKQRLRKVVASTPIAYVEHVDDPRLFAAAVERDLEGIVAKRRGDPYAPETEWVKIKHAGYSQAVERWELFRKR